MIAGHRDESLVWLRQIISADVAVTVGAVSFVLGVYAFVDRLGWLLIAAGCAAVAAAMMAIGLLPLRDGNAGAAIAWHTAGNWFIAIAASFIATFTWPIQILAAILPVVIAVGYVSQRVFRLMIVGAVLVFATAAMLGLLQDVTGLTDSVDEWVTDTVLIVFMPFLAILITQAGARTAEVLAQALEESQAANLSLLSSEEDLRESRSRIVAAADVERRRIERDLHDGAQQRLVGLSLQISLAKEQASSDPAAAQETLDRIRDEVRHAQDEMRALVRGLYPPVLTQHGLGPAVRSLVADLHNPTRTRIDDVPRLGPDREASLYFLCLEAVQNVMKHAGNAATVTIVVETDDATVRVSVADDGPGFDSTTSDVGAGLVNMEDRIGAAGGTVAIESAPGAGTVVSATMPIDG
ncbi:MAG: sensor histidine kinase [Actinomycetota bacterium]